MFHVTHTGPSGSRPRVGGCAEVMAGLLAAVFTVDRSGRVTSWSAEVAALFGRSSAEMAGLTWDVLFGADISSRLEDAFAWGDQGRSWSEVVHAKAGDGRMLRLRVSCSPLLDPQDETVLLCRAGDVELLRRAETQMAFMDELMRGAPFGLVTIDEDLRYVLVNDALGEINGVPAQAHLGRRVGEIVVTEDDSAYEQHMRRTLATGEPLLGMVVSGRTEGHRDTDRAWSVSLFRLTGPDDRVLGLGGVVVDVTDRQIARLEASVARQRLALVNEATTRMGTTLEMPEIARELSTVAVPAFSDMAVVKIRDDLFGDTIADIDQEPVRLRRRRPSTS